MIELRHKEEVPKPSRPRRRIRQWKRSSLPFQNKHPNINFTTATGDRYEIRKAQEGAHSP